MAATSLAPLTDVGGRHDLLAQAEVFAIHRCQTHGFRSTRADKSQALFSEVLGVPQGSVISPKVFCFISMIFAKLQNCYKFVIFLPLTIFCSGKKLKELLSAVEREPEIPKPWFNINKLVNIKKTKLKFFEKRTETEQDGKFKKCVTLKLKEIECLRQEVLGKSMLSPKRVNVSKKIAILYKTKDILIHNALSIIHGSLILPYKSHRLDIWR